MPEIAAYYNWLPGVKPFKKFESREVEVTRIWAVLSPEPADNGRWIGRQPNQRSCPKTPEQLAAY